MIRVSGYGTFEFEGTEIEAEEMRLHKQQWEKGKALKWRKSLTTKLDKVTSDIADHADSGFGIPAELFFEYSTLKGAQEDEVR